MEQLIMRFPAPVHSHNTTSETKAQGPSRRKEQKTKGHRTRKYAVRLYFLEKIEKLHPS